MNVVAEGWDGSTPRSSFFLGNTKEVICESEPGGGWVGELSGMIKEKLPDDSNLMTASTYVVVTFSPLSHLLDNQGGQRDGRHGPVLTLCWVPLAKSFRT